MIDSYNRYSGFCAFCFLVITSTATQRKIVTVIRNIEEIDEIFEEKLGTAVDNQRWMRYAFIDSCIYSSKWNFSLIYIRQKCCAADMLHHCADYCIWNAKLLDVHSRFGAFQWILPYYVFRCISCVWVGNLCHEKIPWIININFLF